MKRLGVLLLVAFTTLPVAHTTLGIGQVNQELMIDKTFDAPEDGQLEILVGDADVTVLSGSGDEIHVAVTLFGKNMDRAREYFEKQQFSVAASGSVIRVASDGKGSFGWNWKEWRDTAPQIQVRVTAPREFDATVHTSDGDIEIGDLTGNIRLKTSDGDITADNLAGPYLLLNTSDGDIASSRLDAESIEIHTSDGDLDLGEVFAGKIVARTSDGDIRIRMIEGIAILKTSDGDLDLGKVEADRFSAHTSDGDINIAQLYGDGEMRTTDGDIYVGALAGSMSSAHSSDGTITISNVEGGLSVTGSDIDVQLHLQAPGKITVATSSGDIKITIPQDHPADLVLRGDDVHMASYVNFEGRMDDEYAKGRINGGGDLIEVHTSDGDVVLQTK